MRAALLLSLVALVSSCAPGVRGGGSADAPAPLEGEPPLGGYGPVI